ncbi:MAG: hypothetical protein SHS37scaffold145_17 [Phage 71_18]|nr:MAG: hypothetical protein SHS37scaffold145_17 [Phage 71_18]
MTDLSNPLPPELAGDPDQFLTDEDLAYLYAKADELAEASGVDWRQCLTDLAGLGSPDVAGPGARWQITDDAGAQWAGAHLAMAEAELRRLHEQAHDWVQRIINWEAEEGRNAARTSAHMTQLLEDYGVRVREAGGPATITLPSVVIKTSEVKPKATVTDDEALADLLDMLYARATTGDEAWDARARAWADATLAAGLDPSELVKRTPKVYVGPLRSLVKLGTVSDGWRYSARLACGHHVEAACVALDDPDVPARGDVMRCPVCPPDAIEGDVSQPVELVVIREITRQVVLGPDGQQVPGTDVDPGGIRPNATPRG